MTQRYNLGMVDNLIGSTHHGNYNPAFGYDTKIIDLRKVRPMLNKMTNKERLERGIKAQPRKGKSSFALRIPILTLLKSI